jgi:hypothetical protein
MENQDNMGGLPPDIRAKLDRDRLNKARTLPGGGIGARVPENATAAAARNSAMGIDDSAATAEGVEQAVEKAPETCPDCKAEIKEGWKYCVACGRDLLMAFDPAKKLGITFTDEDVQDYVFRGFIEKEVSFLGKMRLRIRSSVTRDAREVDAFMMNKSHTADEKTRHSTFHVNQIRELAMSAMGFLALDGKAPAETLEGKIAWLSEKGSHFSDMITVKVVLFNRAVTQFLQRRDSLSG